jgi:hypothetical protein
MRIVKIGDKLRNNDPRSSGQEVTVIKIIQDGPAINQQWAIYQGRTRRNKIRFDKIVLPSEMHHNHLWTLLPSNGGADL